MNNKYGQLDVERNTCYAEVNTNEVWLITHKLTAGIIQQWIRERRILTETMD